MMKSSAASGRVGDPERSWFATTAPRSAIGWANRSGAAASSTEALTALTEWAFAELGLVRLHAAVYARNPASARVLAKAGYEFEGRQRARYFRDGEFIDGLLYAKVRLPALIGAFHHPHPPATHLPAHSPAGAVALTIITMTIPTILGHGVLLFGLLVRRVRAIAIPQTLCIRHRLSDTVRSAGISRENPSGPLPDSQFAGGRAAAHSAERPLRSRSPAERYAHRPPIHPRSVTNYRFPSPSHQP